MRASGQNPTLVVVVNVRVEEFHLALKYCPSTHVAMKLIDI